MGEVHISALPQLLWRDGKFFPACKLLCLQAAASTATHQHRMNLCWTAARPHWPCKMSSGGNGDTTGM